MGSLPRHLRGSDFSAERRAGFCLMGACQDCWVRLEDGRRVRACSTLLEDGQAIRRDPGLGAGPAGITAARTLLDHGVTPVLVDESLRGGGQIYRRQPANFQRSAKQLYGFEAGKATALHRTMDELATRIDYRPETLVWNAENGRLDMLNNGHAESIEYTQIIVATGATDRILPVPGWTLPGVYSLGAAQIALKYQGCAIGERVAFCGSGPLLYLVAYQYAKAGAKVVAVLDSAPFSAQCRALPALLGQPATLAKGLYYRAWLTAHGIPVHQGATL
eukprot:gene16650-20003_t